MPEASSTALPTLFENSRPAPILLAQGAEALLYRSHFLTPLQPCALKYRPPKKWRHPDLDARLTRHRILAEARILVKCRRDGVLVPGVLALDWNGSPLSRPREGGRSNEAERAGGWMMLEWIEGGTVRAALDRWVNPVMDSAEEARGQQWREPLLDLMGKIGRSVGKLHSVGVIHGDLTTSNLMLRPPREEVANGKNESTVAVGSNIRDEPDLNGEIVLIDFGLAAQVTQEEDRAVDLYVLERAFGSTHPTIEDMFQDILQAYGSSYKGAKSVLKKLEDVRMRGRKKTMIG